MIKKNSLKISIGFFIFCLVCLAGLFVTGKAHADEEETIVDNGIPVVYLNIDESQGTIANMLESPDHSVYCYGSFSIDVPEGFHYADFPESSCESIEDLSMSIRGRGNSSWKMSQKKPFKIKLETKTDVLGLGTNKHWVLVANAFDPSLMRDRITGWLGDEMGFAFTPRGVPVDVVMTGAEYGTRYLGSYYLSENVRVGENRLEIAELKESDTDPEVITGGYLLQNAMQVRAGSPDRFYTRRGVDWSTDTPSFDTEAPSLAGSLIGEGEEALEDNELTDAYENRVQQDYIQDYIRSFEDVLFEEGTAYRDLMDIESAAKYWLVQVFSLNDDAYATGSTYIYKDRDTNDSVSKIFWGPLWDFDYAWGYKLETEGFKTGHEWMKPMFYDKGEGGFVQELHKQWPAMRAAIVALTEEGGIIDRYYEETKASADQDFIMYREADHTTYEEQVAVLKNWINERLTWVDENFDKVDDMVYKVTFVADGEVFTTAFMDETGYVDGSERYPEKDGYTFLGWEDKDGNLVESRTPITEDCTFTARYISDSELTHGVDIAFGKNSDVIRYSPFFKVYQINYEVLPVDAQDKKVQWSSSDERIATVDDNGRVLFNDTGTVTITAKLRLGNTRTFTLAIVKDEEIPVPDKIIPEKEKYILSVGEQIPFSFRTYPASAHVSGFSYESDDPEVVTVDELGVLTAVGTGQTDVHITATAQGENGEEQTFTAETSVMVTPAYSEPDNGIPVVYIAIDESEGHTIEDMNSSSDHSVECYGTLQIVVPEGFASCDLEITPESLGPVKLEYIRGRGNTTWSSLKKPYKIKLDKKADVLGLGTNKHWVLLAGSYDNTIFKNRFTGWLGDELGFEGTPRGVSVDVVMIAKRNGIEVSRRNLGNYQLAEQVRVDTNRLEIPELTPEDTAPKDITGGYLLQFGPQTKDGSPNKFYTDRGVGLANHTPVFDPTDSDYTNEVQKEYIRSHIQDMEDAIFGEGVDDSEGDVYKNTKGIRYNEYMDMEAAVKYWLIQEVSSNGDGYITGSTYFYKKPDTFDSSGDCTELGKVYWGPLWDFDFAWGEVDPDNNYTEFQFACPWITAMLYDGDENGFREKINEIWPEVRDKVLSALEDGAIIDQYYAELKDSQAEDYQIWKDVMNNSADFDERRNYPLIVENQKQWIRNRVEWMDSHIFGYAEDHFLNLDDSVRKISYVVDGKTVRREYLRTGGYTSLNYPGYENSGYAPEKEGYVFTGWLTEDGSKAGSGVRALEDRVLTAEFIDSDEAIHAKELIFRASEEWCNIDSVLVFDSLYTILPEDAQERKIAWKSSDDSIAAVDQTGRVTFHETGTVTITAVLSNGAESSYELTILSGQQPMLEEIELVPEEITLKEGEQIHIDAQVLPKLAEMSDIWFIAEDLQIASVSRNGIVTGKAPGTTRIRVETDCYNEESQEYISAEKYCTVTVIEKPAPGWSQIDGKWYYYDQDGNAVTGWQKITDTWYYFDNNGVMQTGWVLDGGKWYYMNSSGAMATGWISDGGKWYYINSSGAMMTGWVSDGGKWYYMNSSGAMVTGWQTVNGTWYYFKSGGDMAAGEWCGGYWLNANGSWTYQPKGSWKKNNQGWWFGDTSGWFAKNTTQRIDNVWYRFDAAGYWK